MLLESLVGQVFLKLLAKVLSIVGSTVGYRRSVKDVQWLIPIVWPPESATASVVSRFLFAKRFKRKVVSAFGPTRLSSVACSVANVSPSRRPNGTL